MPFDLYLEPGESIVYESRRHWWFLFKVLFELALVAIGAPVLLQIAAPTFAAIPQADTAFYALTLLLIVAAGIGAFLVVFKWLNERLILTTDRLISAASADFIWSSSATLDLCDVKDIRVDEIGMGPILGFGDINVKSDPDSDPRTFFFGLPEAERITTLIYRQVETCETTHRHGASDGQ